MARARLRDARYPVMRWKGDCFFSCVLVSRMPMPVLSVFCPVCQAYYGTVHCVCLSRCRAFFSFLATRLPGTAHVRPAHVCDQTIIHPPSFLGGETKQKGSVCLF